MSRPVPTNVKSICGTARKDRAGNGAPGVEIPSLDDEPEMPDWLPNAHAVREWERVVPLVMKLRLLNSANVSTFAHMCALHGTMVQQWQAGLVPSSSVIQQYRALVGEFGLTPVSNSKIKQGGGETPANRFTGHGPRARKPQA